LKPVRLSGHSEGYLELRGTSKGEIEEAIRTANWEAADRGRTQCRKEFAYGAYWNDKYYVTKQVRPIFVEEDDEIVVVTFYTYYY
jgi:hypothetical protein